MSETVRDRLVRGVAAARTGQPEAREEARLALEWVLRQPDADPDQLADAWWGKPAVQPGAETKV